MIKHKVIIAGSRTCPEQSLDLAGRVNNLLTEILASKLEIISGTARGGDTFGEWYSGLIHASLKQFPADWGSLGKRAGYVRNKQMADYATHLIAILDLKVPSKGTRHMINLAKEKGLKIRVIYLNTKEAIYPKIELPLT